METDSDSDSVDKFAEVVIDVNIESTGQRFDNSLKKAVNAAIALKNSCGGVIQLKCESTDEKQIHNWLESYCKKESELASHLGEIDSGAHCCHRNVNGAHYLFVRKTAHILTQNSKLRKRTAKSNVRIVSCSQINDMFQKRTEDTCACSDDTERAYFKMNDVLPKIISESKSVEFKHFPQSTPKDKNEFTSAISKKIKENAAAFANTDGGTLYFGISDDKRVHGHYVANQCEMKEFIEKQIKDMIWIPYSSKTTTTPIIEKHYRIKFIPVHGDDTDRFVIAIHICRFDGTVFLDKPECRTIQDNNQVVFMKFEDWLLHFQNSGLKKITYDFMPIHYVIFFIFLLLVSSSKHVTMQQTQVS